MLNSQFTQAEQVLEDQLVTQLIGLGYARAAVTDEASMLANLKAQLQAIQRGHTDRPGIHPGAASP